LKKTATFRKSHGEQSLRSKKIGVFDAGKKTINSEDPIRVKVGFEKKRGNRKKKCRYPAPAWRSGGGTKEGASYLQGRGAPDH